MAETTPITGSEPLFRKWHVRHGKFTYHPLVVKQRRAVTPNYMRITLQGENVANLYFQCPDDDVRVAIPKNLNDVPGELRVEYEPEYTVYYPDDAPPYEVKAYTVRRYDLDRNEIDLDVALHGKGLGDYWAQHAEPGQTVLVGGAWGSTIYEGTMDHLIMIGDETALPAIGHTIEKQAFTSNIIVVAEVRDEREHQEFVPSPDVNVTVHWVYRGEGVPGKNGVLESAVRELVPLLPNTLYWGMGESATMRSIRRYLADDLGVHRKALSLGGYWKREDDPAEWFYEAGAES